jgi:hypothetical protein
MPPAADAKVSVTPVLNEIRFGVPGRILFD